MKISNRTYSAMLIGLLMISLTLAIASMPAKSFAHGSEGHDENAFTNYDAAKKGLQLFDKLLMKKKLDQKWEINFSTISVTRPTIDAQQDIEVKITRKIGSPESLYIFFDETGKYKGSNFKGK